MNNLTLRTLGLKALNSTEVLEISGGLSANTWKETKNDFFILISILSMSIFGKAIADPYKYYREANEWSKLYHFEMTNLEVTEQHKHEKLIWKTYTNAEGAKLAKLIYIGNDHETKELINEMRKHALRVCPDYHKQKMTVGTSSQPAYINYPLTSKLNIFYNKLTVNQRRGLEAYLSETTKAHESLMNLCGFSAIIAASFGVFAASLHDELNRSAIIKPA